MMKQIAVIREPMVVRKFLGSRVIGTIFHVVLQCDKCRRVTVAKLVRPDESLPDSFIGCCETCRICGGGPHIPGGSATALGKSYEWFMHVFALERRQKARDSAMMEERRP
jgi:hypothetical protein